MRAVNASQRVLGWIAAALLVAIAILTGVDVIGRYLLNVPIYGSVEMIQFLLAGLVFSSFGLVSLHDGHISVDLLSGPLSRRFPQVQRIGTGLPTIIGLTIIGWQLLRLGIEALVLDRNTIVIEWPLAAIIFPCAVMCLVAALLETVITFAPSTARSPIGQVDDCSTFHD